MSGDAGGGDVSVYRDGDQWRYRKVVHRMDGTKVRISGTPDINTEEHALLAELANVQREIAKELAERTSVDVTEVADFTEVELSRYEAAARRAGVTLREFIISACDAVVAYEAAQEFCDTTPDAEPVF